MCLVGYCSCLIIKYVGLVFNYYLWVVEYIYFYGIIYINGKVKRFVVEVIVYIESEIRIWVVNNGLVIDIDYVIFI